MEKTTLFISLFASLILLFTIIPITPLPQYLSPLIFNHKNTVEEEDAFSSLSFIAEEPSMYPTADEEEIQFRNEYNQLVEDDVVVLTNRNFSEFVALNQYVMVNFYAPWCYFSKQVAPEYAAAATMLKGTTAVLAKVDCTREIELARLFKIQGYPTLTFLVDGGAQQVLFDPTNERTRDAIANWVTRKMNFGVQNLVTMEEAERALAGKSTMVLGFLDSLEGSESEGLEGVSKLHMDVNFYQTSNVDIAKLFRIDHKPPALVLLKKEGHNHTQFNHEGQFSGAAIADFVSIYKTPSVITFRAEDASEVFENPLKQLWLFAPLGSCEVLSIFKETANAFKGKLLFVHVEIIGNEGSSSRNLAYEFGVNEEAPTVVARYITVDGTKKHLYRGELTLSSIKSFAEEVLEGKFVVDTKTWKERFLRLPSQSDLAVDSDPIPFPHIY